MLTGATFAWFTERRSVSTDSVTARVPERSCKLELSTLGGADFHPEESPRMSQISDCDDLFPVSTADLRTFVHCTSSGADGADEFCVCPDESEYYHACLYLRATGMESGQTMKLYLDESAAAGGLLGGAEENELPGGARLGLRFEGADPVIFTLRGAESVGRGMNTILNGELLAEGNVLKGGNDSVTAVPDPAVPVETYAVSYTDGSLNFPRQPLAELEADRITRLDVYFYLEGCDPDCVNSLMSKETDLHLAFYGVPVK